MTNEKAPSVSGSGNAKDGLDTDDGFSSKRAVSTVIAEADTSKVLLEKARHDIETPATISQNKLDVDDCPDGGFRAWLVVCGGIANTLATFGFVNAWAAFQSYYQQTILHDESASNIAWIGSIQYSLVFLPGLFTGRLFDLGYFKLPLFIASCVLVAATFLTAQCTKYWQFILCQGVAVGLSAGVIFGPTLAVIAHWFKKKRGRALGFLAVGSSIGGTVFPIVFNQLVFKIGFPWTMRVLGFLLLFSLGIANFTLARRLPPVNVAGGLFNWRTFRSAPFTLYTVAGFITFLGLYTVLTYIDISAASNGVSAEFSFYLVSIANASSGFGRIGAGFLADRIGAVNVMVPFTALAGVLTYIWPFVHGKGPYIAVAVIYGFSSGAYVSLIGAPMIAFGETGDVGRRTGMYFSVLCFGALAGPPISGAIADATGGYKAVGEYAGSTVLLSIAIMWYVKYLVVGNVWGKF